jgi:CNT family concentrative nucleoside transporter
MTLDSIPILNLISFAGIFFICAIAWLFSENRAPKYFPWRVVVFGILLQLSLGFLVFWFPPTKFALDAFSRLIDGVFIAADAGARFVFGPALIPPVGEAPQPGIGTIFAFRVLPTVIFFGGFMALLYNLGLIQPIVNFFARVFYRVMRLSGAESLSGAANIFVGIEAAIVVRPFLAKMTRSELCTVLSCCFGTAASSTLAIYVRALENVFPNILVHLISASIIAIPACFMLSKILVPETEVPLTAAGIPDRNTAAPEQDDSLPQVDGDSPEHSSPVDAAILGSIEGLKMAATIAAILIFIVGIVSLINQIFAALAALEGTGIPVLTQVGQLFRVVTIENLLGALFLPLTLLTGVSLDLDQIWTASVLIGSRLLQTAIPSYTLLGQLGEQGVVNDRTILIVSYALSGFAHVASVGIFVGGLIALIPSRRKDISELGWKGLFVGTLATVMIACVAGVFDTGDPSILGRAVEPGIEAPAPDAAPETAAPETVPEPLPGLEAPAIDPPQS